MSSFSISSTLTLRNMYGDYRALITKTNRNTATNNQLSYADATALKRAVKKLNDYDFEDASEENRAAYLRAFVDTYNYTMQSTKSSTNTYAASAYKGLKNLVSKYSDELEEIGISANSSGYLKLSSSSATNLSGSTFDKFFTNDSKFMKSVLTYAKKVTSNVDYYA